MMKRLFLIHILLFALMCSCPLFGQSYTLFSKAIISIDSVPQGAEVFLRGECIGTTPCKVEVPSEYLVSCDAPGAESMNQTAIKAYNSSKMEMQMKRDGTEDGQFNEFSMEFTFCLDGSKEGRQSLHLMWAPAEVFGSKGTRIFYPDSLVYRF